MEYQVGMRDRSGSRSGMRERSGSDSRRRSGSWNMNELLNPLTVLNSGDGKAATKLADHFTVNPFPTVVTRRRSSIDVDLHKARKLNDLLNDLLGPIEPQHKDAEQNEATSKCPPAPPTSHCADVHDNKDHVFWKNDYASDTWDWPLHGEMKVKSTDDEFEVTFDFRPFTADEVEVHVLCTDLFIRCHRDARQTPVAIKGDQCVHEVMRNYALPANVDTQSIRFYLNSKEGKLRITAEKIPPLKVNVAVYLEMADVHRLRNGLPLVDIVRLKHLRDSGATIDQLTKELERCFAKCRELEKQKAQQREQVALMTASCAEEVNNVPTSAHVVA